MSASLQSYTFGTDFMSKASHPGVCGSVHLCSGGEEIAISRVGLQRVQGETTTGAARYSQGDCEGIWAIKIPGIHWRILLGFTLDWLPAHLPNHPV